MAIKKNKFLSVSAPTHRVFSNHNLNVKNSVHTNMSDSSNRNPKPPFRGFTDLFRRVNGPKEDVQTPSKKVEPSEYEPRRLSSQKLDAVDHGRPAAQPVVQQEKSPPIIVPPLVTYEEWFADRINHAVTRCREIYGPIDEGEQPVDEDVRRLVGRIRRCISGNSPGSHDKSCQCVDCRTSSTDRREIYEHCNVNAYPQKYDFDLLNKRLRKMITNKSDSRWLREFVRRSILKDDVLRDRDEGGDYDRYGAKREELTLLINDRLHCPPNKRVSFQPDTLAEWRARFAFKVDKKYKFIPKVTSSTNEDFYEWLGRVRDLFDRKRNKDAIKRSPNKLAMGDDESLEEPGLGTSLEARKPSLSHCRSEFYFNGRRV